VEGAGTETGGRRQPIRRRSDKESTGTEPENAKIEMLGVEGAGTETGCQRQPGRRRSEEGRAGTELGAKIL
jgi:hypothetical protein